MENFLNRLGCLVLGLTLGALSGYLSTYGLDQLSAFWRPPLVFWVVNLIVVVVFARKNLKQWGILILPFWGIYLLGMILGISMTLLFGLGGILVFYCYHRFFKLSNNTYFIAGCILLVAIGLTFDILHLLAMDICKIDGFNDGHQAADETGREIKWLIILWQTITLGAISLQLYTETRYRQSEEVQKNTVGQGEEIPNEHYEHTKPSVDGQAE